MMKRGDDDVRKELSFGGRGSRFKGWRMETKVWKAGLRQEK